MEEKKMKYVASVIIVMLMLVTITTVSYLYFETVGKNGEASYDGLIPEEPDIPKEPDIPEEPEELEEVYEDSEFLAWMRTALNDIAYYADLELEYLDSESWYLLEYYAGEEETLVGILQDECNEFEVSMDCWFLQTEFDECLFDRSMAAMYFKWAAQWMQLDNYENAADNLNDATSYTRQATAHITRITELLADME